MAGPARLDVAGGNRRGEEGIACLFSNLVDQLRVQVFDGGGDEQHRLVEIGIAEASLSETGAIIAR